MDNRDDFRTTVEENVPHEVDNALDELQQAIHHHDGGFVVAVVVFNADGSPGVILPRHVDMNHEAMAALSDVLVLGLELGGFVGQNDGGSIKANDGR